MKTIHLIGLGLALSSSALAAPKNDEKANLDVTSSAFTASGDIPKEYTCEGGNISPPITWSKVPSATKSIALLVEDPDAPHGGFVHWLVTGIPPTTTTLTPGAALPEGATAAKNGKGEAAYTGPCPPSGKHHYVFTVYALDIPLGKKVTKADLVAKVGGHVLAEGQLIGLYQKEN